MTDKCTTIVPENLALGVSDSGEIGLMFNDGTGVSILALSVDQALSVGQALISLAGAAKKNPGMVQKFIFGGETH